MAAGTCAICDADTTPGAGHCSSCGADLDAIVIEIDPDHEPAQTAMGPSRHRVGSRRRTVAALACLVLAGFVGGRLAFVPVDGGDAVALGSAENELLRVGAAGIVVRSWTAAPPEIVSIAFDGRVRWRFEPPPGTSAIGVTAAGEVLVQTGQTIVAVDPALGTSRPVTDGVGRADVPPRGPNRGSSAADTTGASVSAEDSTVIFREGDGTVVATIASPVMRTAARVALVPAAVTP